jgi:hypothetical protein
VTSEGKNGPVMPVRLALILACNNTSAYVTDWMTCLVGLCLTVCQHKEMSKSGRSDKTCKAECDQRFCRRLGLLSSGM